MEDKKEVTKKTKVEDCVTDQGLLISGNGMIANNTEKTNEILDKSQKFLYFMEKRQAEMLDVMKQMLEILKQKA